MGVHGLWELLAPVGRRVSVDTLSSRKLAIDASIWIIQFMKAMRDDKGDMIRNAHLLGFFRRICKLLFLRVKPVFVFDGGTPALKRRTVIARRRQRENAQSKIRKTAEKLLLNHIRTRKLEEIATDINPQRPPPKSKKVGMEDSDAATVNAKLDSEENDQVNSGSAPLKIKYDQMQADAQLAASLSRDYAENQREVEQSEDDDDDGEEELILPPAKGLDPSVLASLPPSMQLDLLVQMREQLVAENRQRFQNVAKVPSSFSQMQIQAYLKTVAFRREINEVQKAAAGGGIGGVPTARVASTTDREFIFSKSFEGDKPAPSEVEEHTRAEQTPPKESNQANLPKSWMKPSSVLVSSLAERQDNAAPEEDVISLVSTQLNEDSTPNSSSMVHTYVDEKGHVRVNRRRGMGVRMTRDLQWNLYLMKDSEARSAEGKAPGSMPPIIPTSSTVDEAAIASVPEQPNPMPDKGIKISFVDDEGFEDSKDEDGGLFEELVMEEGDASKTQGSTVVDQSCDADKDVSLGTTDGVVEDGGGVEDEQVEWEDGANENGVGSVVDDKELAEAMRLSRLEPGTAPPAGSEEGGQQILLEDGPSSEESEVEWDDGTGDMSAADLDGIPREEMSGEAMIAGEEEEAEIQEAIRRSLEDYVPSLKPSSQLKIKEPATTLGENHEPVGSDDLHATAPMKVQVQDDASSMRGELESEELFLARERTRKGKAVVNGDDGKTNISAALPVASVISQEVRYVSLEPVIEPDSPLPAAVQPFQSPSPESKSRFQGDERMYQHASAHETARLTSNGDSVLRNNLETDEKPTREVAALRMEDFDNSKVQDRSASVYEAEAKKDSTFILSSMGFSHPTGPVPSELGKSLDDQVEPLATTDELKIDNVPVPAKEEVPMSVEDDLLREAEEFDIEAEREQMQSNERAIAAEMERLAQEEANLQEELEMEQEEMRAGIERERILLEKEQSELRSQQKKNERNAESVTGEMFAEVQELLQMFGLPYLIAPMEAEAQCAYMDIVQLVDGVVTDDSDAFLFGGRTVYKNLFDDRKYVETYFMKDLESEMGMTREKLIRIAMLLGSDYTEGISGIGIVNAIEVVNAFPEEDGLQKFKEWLDSPDHTLFEMKRGLASEKSKRGTKDTTLDGTEGNDMNKSEDSEFTVTQRLFMGKHRAVSKNWAIPESFPSDAVVKAYVSPTVDKSKEAFAWGRPDLEALRKFCRERFIWSKEKADELILPVLKEYDRRETQTRLENFYQFNQRFAKIRSSRIQKAVSGMTGKRSAELMDLPAHLIPEDPPKKPRRKKAQSANSVDNELAEGIMDENFTQNDDRVPGESNQGKRGRTARGGVATRKKAPRKQVQSSEARPLSEGTEDDINGSIDSRRGRSAVVNSTERGKGRGRSRGRGTRRGVVRAADEEDEASASDGSDGIDDVNETMDSIEKLSENPRRSTRQRTKVPSYHVDNSDEELDGACSDGEQMFRKIDTLVADALQKGNAAAPQQVARSVGAPAMTDVEGTEPLRQNDQIDVKNSPQLNNTGNNEASSPREDVELREDGAEILLPSYFTSGGGFCVSDDEDTTMPPPEGEVLGDNQPEGSLPDNNEAEDDPPNVESAVAVEPTLENTPSQGPPRSEFRVMPQLRRRKRQD